MHNVLRKGIFSSCMFWPLAGAVRKPPIDSRYADDNSSQTSMCESAHAHICRTSHTLPPVHQSGPRNGDQALQMGKVVPKHYKKGDLKKYITKSALFCSTCVWANMYWLIPWCVDTLSFSVSELHVLSISYLSFWMPTKTIPLVSGPLCQYRKVSSAARSWKWLDIIYGRSREQLGYNSPETMERLLEL